MDSIAIEMILVWEDGFCNFAASEVNTRDCSVYGDHEYQHGHGLQPELFFKMSHEIYNYGEGLIGKVAADHTHKWIFKEPNDQEINFLSAWNNSADSYPRTWEAQFQSGIKTIALIAVREGVIQLGSIHKAIEDLNYVVLLRKKLSYIESIPGVLLPHPSSTAYPFKLPQPHNSTSAPTSEAAWHMHIHGGNATMVLITTLEALLSKLPSVVPVSLSSSSSPSVPLFCEAAPPHLVADHYFWAVEAAKEEEEDAKDGTGECSSSNTSAYHHDLNVSSCMPNNTY
ncbi:hypothetical protein R6Q57_022301 [Mikania cordata]